MATAPLVVPLLVLVLVLVLVLTLFRGLALALVVGVTGLLRCGVVAGVMELLGTAGVSVSVPTAVPVATGESPSRTPTHLGFRPCRLESLHRGHPHQHQHQHQHQQRHHQRVRRRIACIGMNVSGVVWLYDHNRMQAHT